MTARLCEADDELLFNMKYIIYFTNKNFDTLTLKTIFEY